ncbi:MAG: DUF4258 domain-containing protein [bacterium]
MAEDEIGILDVECAILKGKLVRKEADEPRGVKYTIVGKGRDQTTNICVVGRFKGAGIFLIITVYKL